MAGIYIHIPYCKKACIYCNFHFRTSQNDQREMLKCIELELQSRRDYLKNKIISTIYFGGGTPSLLNKDEIKSILEKINKNFKLNKNIEITLECNPDDLSQNKLIEFKELGINRLSIGVQSFNDNHLSFMNRSHSCKESIEGIRIAKKVGFNNITIDLIYGIPNQTLSEWKKDLEKMFALDITHFSSYALTVEDNTRLNFLVKNKKIKPLNDSKVNEQFMLLVDIANHYGFIQYEISNFATNEYFSKHNTSYWENKHYIGVGPSAHSYNGRSRRWNISSNKKYIKGIITNDDYFEDEILTIQQQYNEYILTSLRTIWGVCLKSIKNRFPKKIHTHFIKEVKKWKTKKLIKKNGSIYTLTSSGKLLADSISSDLFLLD